MPTYPRDNKRKPPNADAINHRPTDACINFVHKKLFSLSFVTICTKKSRSAA